MNNLQTSIYCNNTQFILHVLIHFWTNNNIEDLLCAALYKFPSGPTRIAQVTRSTSTYFSSLKFIILIFTVSKILYEFVYKHQVVILLSSSIWFDSSNGNKYVNLILIINVSQQLHLKKRHFSKTSSILSVLTTYLSCLLYQLNAGLPYVISSPIIKMENRLFITVFSTVGNRKVMGIFYNLPFKVPNRINFHTVENVNGCIFIALKGDENHTKKNTSQRPLGSLSKSFRLGEVEYCVKDLYPLLYEDNFHVTTEIDKNILERGFAYALNTQNKNSEYYAKDKRIRFSNNTSNFLNPYGIYYYYNNLYNVNSLVENMLFVSKHTIWCENETYLHVSIVTIYRIVKQSPTTYLQM
ncbi:hypothetical protein AGLY_012616 [Aphis glycines]|uniref:Uncharacterized protein n=1 Tax=Aphis glycines TaxID=307491 RepID=A0A6G0T8V4_APHGL|nr:hypothetical protein AGLY_012616 [Aphis glycines]